ncbi:YqaJ viral recombinase family nuclease [Psychrobacter ciconiae]|uniref:YqaJ viral recombinase family nuclease n=1 Tax=Psychrobacter ciconiae TaxID=1553449 RepID=UPI00191AA0F1|nr:YqaJ viral recombinase family protein [Psychrobacter ciconiae]
METIALKHSNPNTNPTKRLSIKPSLPLTQDKTSTAKRLVNTKNLTHDQWLEVRKQGIGSSDAAAACGIHPYLSMLELWMIKTGRLKSDIDEKSDSYAPLYWGKMLEPLVAKSYQEQTGNKVRRVNAVLQHPDKPFMLANLDYQVVGSEEVQILECKTTGEHGSKLWKNGVPLYVTCQVQHQLAVTGKKAAHICVLLAGHETKIFKVDRDEKLIESIIEYESRFWQFVTADTPPPPDHSESAAKALKLLYPNPKPESKLDCTHDDQANALFDELLSYRDYMEELQQRHDKVKHQLQRLITDHEIAVFARGAISWKKSKDSVSLDSKALLKAHPELIEKFGKTRSGSRRFVVLDK